MAPAEAISGGQLVAHLSLQTLLPELAVSLSNVYSVMPLAPTSTPLLALPGAAATAQPVINKVRRRPGGKREIANHKTSVGGQVLHGVNTADAGFIPFLFHRFLREFSHYSHHLFQRDLDMRARSALAGFPAASPLSAWYFRSSARCSLWALLAQRYVESTWKRR